VDQLAAVQRHRDDLLEQLAELVRERDEYRSRARRLEAQRALAMDEAARMRRERDSARAIVHRMKKRQSERPALPDSDLHARTERRLAPVRTEPELPEEEGGGYSLLGERVPEEDPPRSRPCRLMLADKE